jgi:hypothetical protein
MTNGHKIVEYEFCISYSKKIQSEHLFQYTQRSDWSIKKYMYEQF